MIKNTDFHEYIISDVLFGIDGITSKFMFGGYGIYKNGIIFAIIINGQFYMKTDQSTEKEYANRGSEPFVYTGHKNKKAVTMPYWTLPEEIMEDKHVLEEWIDKAIQVSLKSKKKKVHKKK